MSETQPEMLDLFACEGGATAGYMRAGFHVTAVDTSKARLKWNPTNPRIIGDAFDYAEKHGHKFDAVHMSPPRQFYTRGNAMNDVTDKWPRLIGRCRELGESLGIPYVIENVKDARWDMKNPTALCGCMFNLSTMDDDGIQIYMQRIRLFETSFDMSPPRACDHSFQEWWAGAYGGARRDKYEAKYVRKGGYVPPNKDVVSRLLGVEHSMTWNGLFESIPPAYTEYIGHRIREIL